MYGICLSVYQSDCLSSILNVAMCLPTYLQLSIYLSITYLYIYQSSTYLYLSSINLSIIYLPIFYHQSIYYHLFIYLLTHLHIYTLSIYLSIYLSISLSISLSTFLSSSVKRKEMLSFVIILMDLGVSEISQAHKKSHITCDLT
jgi:hypothetical protein